MAIRKWTRGSILVIVLFIGGAACAAPSNLPAGPTPIPTLIPVTDMPILTESTQEPAFVILSYPAQLPASDEGSHIYIEHCAECHGEDGSGVVPGSRNFQDLDYMRGETIANFYAAISEGRGEMPAYNQALSSDDRWDVTFYIWRHSTSFSSLERGREIYEENCATCHGVNGSGELLGSADFTDLRQMDMLAPRDLYLTVTQGRGSMPAMQSLLSQDDRWSVIDYLLTFVYDPSLEGDIGSTGTNGSSEEGESVEISCLPDQENPFAWDDMEAISSGGSIYQDRCAVCHGQDGTGGLPSTPDFSSAEVNTDLINSPGISYCAVAQGVGTMPGFAETLSADEIWQVLTHIASFGP